MQSPSERLSLNAKQDSRAIFARWRCMLGEGSVAEAASSELWKDLRPSAEVFKPDALRDAFIADAPTDDKKYYVPFVWHDEEDGAGGSVLR